MTTETKNRLIEALIRCGYNLTDARNAANGPRAEELAKEYLKVSPVDEFFAKHLNQYRDYDKKFGYQCMDLLRFYLRDVCHLDAYSLPAVPYAKDLWAAYDRSTSAKSHFEKIPNTPKGVPEKGDIVIWRAWAWSWRGLVTREGGHVGFFSEGDVNTMIIFHQNWPEGKPCQFQKFSYAGVLGWFRPRKG